MSGLFIVLSNPVDPSYRLLPEVAYYTSSHPILRYKEFIRTVLLKQHMAIMIFRRLKLFLWSSFIILTSCVDYLSTINIIRTWYRSRISIFRTMTTFQKTDPWAFVPAISQNFYRQVCYIGELFALIGTIQRRKEMCLCAI